MNTVYDYETNHEGIIHDCQYDFMGKRLACCYSDGFIQIYDVENKDKSIQQTCSFKAHSGCVWSIDWANPCFGTIIASCGYDKKVSVWQEISKDDWIEIYSYSEHTASVNNVSWISKENVLILVASSSDGRISFSQIQNGKWMKVFKEEVHDQGVNKVVWSPLINNQLRLATASCDNLIKIWSYDSDNQILQLVKTLDGHKNWVRDISWNQNFDSPYDYIASCSEDQTCIIWKISRDDEQLVQRTLLDQFEGPTWHVSWSKQGNLLAVSSASITNDNMVQVFEENDEGQWNLNQKLLNQ